MTVRIGKVELPGLQDLHTEEARTLVEQRAPKQQGSVFQDLGREPLTLTRKETGILEYLMLNQGRPISQEELIDHVWDNSVDNFSNSIRVHISALRKKLRTALGYDPIRNRIGEGYLIEGAEE